VKVALGVDRQQIDALAESGDDLPADDEQVAEPEDVDPRLDEVLQALLGRQRRGRDLRHGLAVHAPQPEVHRHAAMVARRLSLPTAARPPLDW
jgi:hypothetical protein